MGLFNKKKTTELFNPVRGNVVPLSSVHDEVFASEAMGLVFFQVVGKYIALQRLQ